MSFLKKKKNIVVKKNLNLEFNSEGNLINNLSSDDENLIFSCFSNKNKKQLNDLKNAIEVINSKFIFERKKLMDLRDEISKKKETLLKTDDDFMYQCKICYENIIDTAIPCGHVFCSSCAFSSKAHDGDFICPICRTVIKKSKKIYVS